MSWADAPMTTLSVDEWRAYKRATRRLKYAQRLQQVTEPDPTEFLAAVRRDDAGDHVLEEQAAPALEVAA